MIIIFSQEFDYSTYVVSCYLRKANKKVITICRDTDTYVFERADEEGIYFRNRPTGELVNLKAATACWWRRDGLSARNLLEHKTDKKLKLPAADISAFTRLSHAHLVNEIAALRDYIYRYLYNHCAITLGHPFKSNLNRLALMDMARSVGLKTPGFEIITTGGQLQKSRKKIGQAVTKAISDGIYTELNENRFYTYTELLEKKAYREYANTFFFPSLVSALINKKIEIRSFYICGSFFSMAIFSQGDENTRIDFRKYGSNRHEPFALPRSVERKLEQIFNRLGLNCGSADLILDERGEFVFLEINPVGQYGMTSLPCHYNLDQKIANYLQYGRIS